MAKEKDTQGTAAAATPPQATQAASPAPVAPSQGGSYVVKDGQHELVEQTQPHNRIAVKE